MPDEGDFHAGENWSPFGIPTSSDRIVIPDGKTCTVTQDATVERMEVVGKVVIKTGDTLTL